jgi:hypothetical protein
MAVKKAIQLRPLVAAIVEGKKIETTTNRGRQHILAGRRFIGRWSDFILFFICARPTLFFCQPAFFWGNRACCLLARCGCVVFQLGSAVFAAAHGCGQCAQRCLPLPNGR